MRVNSILNVTTKNNMNFFGNGISTNTNPINTLDSKAILPPQKPLTPFEKTKKFIPTETFTTNPLKLKKEASPLQELRSLHMDDNSIFTAQKNKLDLKKLAKVVKNISTEKTTKAFLQECPFDKENNFLVMADTAPNAIALNLVDRTLNVLAKEEKASYRKAKPDIDGNKKSSSYTINKIVDYRNNTTTVIKSDVDDKYRMESVSSEITTKRNKNGELLRKSTLTKSEIPGVFNVKYDFPNGKSRILSNATIDKKSGNTIITKDMRSNDMTRTQYRYEDDPNGNRLIDYKITDVHGNVLMNQSQTFEKISDNKFVSSRNNNIFDIEVTKEALNVTDRTKKELHSIPLKGFVKGNENKILNLLKTVPGDELINLKKNVINVEEIPDRLESYCQTTVNEDKNGKLTTNSILAVSDDLFVFLHELGHATDLGGKDVDVKYNEYGQPYADIKNMLNTDEKFKKTYSEERTNYLKEFPDAQRNYVGYFIESEAVKGQKDRGRKETIAETNALLNTYNSVDELAIRSQYLQQHFPRTIAYLSTKLTMA